MKQSLLRSRSTQRSGFTLVELLVVMSIIAILASVLFAVGSAALRSAKRTAATNTAQQISAAANAYYTEYNVYPVVAGAQPADTYYANTDANNWTQLTEVLAGNINTTSTSFGTAMPSSSLGNLNARGIAYMTPRPGDLDKNTGAYKNPFSPAGASTYFFMAFDSDYDGLCGDSGTASGVIPDFPNSTTKTGIKFLTGASGLAGGNFVWCNNDQKVTGTTNNNPSLWSRTW